MGYVHVPAALFVKLTILISDFAAYEDVCKVIEEDLGATPDELFTSFEKEPIATASLAQVHVAYDKESGEKLAVKVQHRGLRETSSGDVFAITTVIHILDFMFEDFTWMWIAEEIAPQVSYFTCGILKHSSCIQTYSSLTVHVVASKRTRLLQ